MGGRLGPVFDEDPKRWRMLAESLATLGMSLEIATAFAPPQAFLLLAGPCRLPSNILSRPCDRHPKDITTALRRRRPMSPAARFGHLSFSPDPQLWADFDKLSEITIAFVAPQAFLLLAGLAT